MAERLSPPNPARQAPEARPGAATLALRAVVSLALVAGTALVARVPLGEPPRDAALRLALRTTHARLEVCREPSEQELAALPIHMRSPRICTETALDYHLTVKLDGTERLARTVSPSGLRRTRPLAVEATLPTPAGARHLELHFAPVPPPPDSPPDLLAAYATLPALHLDTPIDLEPGRILLVTLTETGEALFLRETPR